MPIDEETAQALATEITLAAVGLVPILEGKPRLPAHPPNLPKEIRKLVLEFLAHPKASPLTDLPPFDWQQAYQLLEGTGTEAHIEALRSAIPGPLGNMVHDRATVIIAALAQQLPKSTREDGIGATIVEPGPDMAVDRFRRMWAVALDPMVVLRELCDGSVSSDMVLAFAQFWPALYDVTKQQLLDGVAEMRTKRATWDPEPRRARLIRTLLMLAPVNFDVAADFQQLYAQQAAAKAAQAPAPKKKSATAAKDPDSMLTPGQE